MALGRRRGNFQTTFEGADVLEGEEGNPSQWTQDVRGTRLCRLHQHCISTLPAWDIQLHVLTHCALSALRLIYCFYILRMWETPDARSPPMHFVELLTVLRLVVWLPYYDDAARCLVCLATDNAIFCLACYDWSVFKASDMTDINVNFTFSAFVNMV